MEGMHEFNMNWRLWGRRKDCKGLGMRMEQYKDELSYMWSDSGIYEWIKEFDDEFRIIRDK